MAAGLVGAYLAHGSLVHKTVNDGLASGPRRGGRRAPQPRDTGRYATVVIGCRAFSDALGWAALSP